MTHTHESYSGSTFNSLGVEANQVSTVTLSSIDLEEDEWISLLEVSASLVLFALSFAVFVFLNAVSSLFGTGNRVVCD